MVSPAGAVAVGRIDPDGGGEWSRDGGSFHKALGVFQIGSLQDLLTLIQNGLSSSEMNIGRREETDSAVMMFVVVPAEELLPPKSRASLLTTKTFRIIGSIFQGFELCFRERIIVGNVWTGVGLRDTQIGHEQGHRFRRHRTAAVRMNRQLTRLNALANTSGCDQFFRQTGRIHVQQSTNRQSNG